MRRENPEAPIVAVGGVILEQDGRILLVKRGKPPDSGKWSVPGGTVEAGETLIDALKREIKEECSIEISDPELFLIIERIFIEREKAKYHYLIFDFLIEEFNGEVEALSDALECKSFSFQEISSINASSSLLKFKDYLEKYCKTGKPIHIVSKEKGVS